MLILTDKQFYGYLTTYILENKVDEAVPDVLCDYIIPNKALQQFIDSDMVQVWNENVDWDKERQGIVDEILWNIPTNVELTSELEDWLTCYGVISYKWETDQKVHVELEYDELEFLQYVQKHFKHVEKDGAREWTYNYEINSYEDECGNKVSLLDLYVKTMYE